MPLNSQICPNDNPLLTEERTKATFDTNQMAAVIYEGHKFAERRREITRKIAEIPDLHDTVDPAFMSREEKIENSARKSYHLTKHLDKIADKANPAEMAHVTNEVIGCEGNPLALHASMFMPSLIALASDEQKSKWLTRAINREIIGTYAQTEMGHGTNLRKLETTATFDKSAQEFVLHSPTTTSLKWWPGNLGKSTCYAIVAATLFIDGKNYGPHNFMVQLRDEKTYVPLKGITVGDIGPKMAYNATDNGFLGFDHHRILRENMLSKHSQVLADGTYVKPKHAKVGYATMVHVRAHMVTHQGQFIAYATTIAIRYSVVRKQGEIQEGKGEVKILDYQTQQHRLFPMLARSFAFIFTGVETRKLYYRVLQELDKGKVSNLADLHAVTSGLKSVVTYQAGQAIEQARMSCGGHGYSKASNIPEIYGVAIGGATYEGENMVMLLQCARYLMKAAHEARNGQPLSPLVQYLTRKYERVSRIGTSTNQDYSAHLSAFEHISRKQIFKAADRLEKLVKDGNSRQEAWNKNGVELNRAARLHTRYFIALCFYEAVAQIADSACRVVLQDLLHLHLDYELLDMAGYLLQDDYLSSHQIDWLKDDMYRLLAKIRPNAVSLVDSFEFSDRELRSVLGRRDGHVYENLYKWAKASELNRDDPKKSLYDANSSTYQWTCSANDCFCVNGTQNGTKPCLEVIDQCINAPCPNNPDQHWKCTTGINSHKCSCATGWMGDNCDVQSSSPCSSSPCLNGGTCVEGNSTIYTCECQDKYSGTRCEKFDYCSNTTCANWGTCQNVFDNTDFYCNCTDLWQDRFCKTSNIVFEDAPWKDGCYDWNNVLDDPQKYPNKWANNWMTVDLCKLHFENNRIYTYFTVSEKTCYLSNTSYLDKKENEDWDWDCQVTCPGDNNQRCGKKNSRAFVYKYDSGKVDENPCGENATFCSADIEQGICVNMASSADPDYMCICHPMYTGDDCESLKTNPCLDDPPICQNNGTCSYDWVTYKHTCKCDSDYKGENCEYPKQCMKTTCKNGGTCVEKDDGSFDCECLNYYHGDYCEEISRCEYDKPCGDHGTCSDGPYSGIDPEFNCTCSNGWMGPRCENETNECVPDPCKNGATCEDLPLAFKCHCADGTNGNLCENIIPFCVPTNYDGQWAENPCKKKDGEAKCVEKIGGFACNCSKMWIGELCDMNVIIRDVLLAIYGRVELTMIPMLEDLLKSPALIKDMVPFILGLLDYDARLPLSWTADDIFEYIAYEEESLDPQIHLNQWNDVVLGNCFTLNHRMNTNYTFKMRDGGSLNGVRAKLKIMVEEYVPWTDTSGILVFVHNIEDYIFSESIRYMAEPNGEFMIDIFDTEYTRLGGRYGKCARTKDDVDAYYYDGLYATEGCLRTCYQKMINSSCGCMDPRYPVPPGNPLCELSERPCVEGSTKEAGDPSTWPDCVCHLPCSNQQYTVTWTRSRFTSRPVECEEDPSPGCKEKEQEKVSIKVRVTDLTYQVYAEIPSMTFNRFISYLGGLLGILNGLSIVSLIEFVFLFVKISYVAVSGKNL